MSLSREAVERWYDMFKFSRWADAIGLERKAKWKRNSSSKDTVFLKRCLHKSERQRCRLDVECAPEYRRKKGYLL